MAIKYRENGQSVTRANIGGGGAGSVSDFQVNYTISMDNTNRVVNEPIIVKAGTGDFTVSSSDSTVVTASVNNTTKVITLEGLKYGSAVITVTMAASGSYEACTKSIEVTSRCFIPVVGQSYTLGSGAHTGGSVDLECVVLDKTGDRALCITKGVCGGAWTDGVVDITSYLGDLSGAISDVYLVRGNADGSTTTTAPTSFYVYNGSSFVNTYSESVRTALLSATTNYATIGATYSGAWIGTTYQNTVKWWFNPDGSFGHGVDTAHASVICPTFILDLTKVKLHGTLICLLTEPDMPEIVPWSTNDDDKIAAMVAADAAGYLNLYDWWSDNDEKTVTLSAMAATGVGESHVSQDVTFVLSKDSCKQLSSALTSGRAYSKYLIHQKNCLEEKGYMNSTDSNVGSWKNSSRRSWCNSVFYNAIPSTIKAIFKQFKNLTAQTYNGSTNETVDDYFGLAAAKEVFGGTASAAGTGTGNSNLTEFNALTQFEYYKTSSNRIKKLGNDGSAVLWLERSLYFYNSSGYCAVYASGGVGSTAAITDQGISPFGVI